MNRIQSVDTLRAVAIIFVIIIHTTPFEIQSSPIGHTLSLATVIAQLARFAVPFFFILSGYFWAQKIKDENEIYGPTKKMVKRILFIFVVWSLVYLLPTNFFDSFNYGIAGPIKRIYWNLRDAFNDPLTTLMQGTRIHLWFLVGLISSVSISALILQLNQKYLLIIVAIAFYVLGLAGMAYRDTPLGFYTSFNLRNGPFFSLIFFVTGYFLQQKKLSSSWFPIGLTIAVFGILLQFIELIILNKYWATTMYQDYVIGTYFFGVGVTLIALSKSGYLDYPRIASIAPLVLGIYTSHYIFIDLLKPLDRYFSNNRIWDVLYIVLVFVLSSTLTQILYKFRITKKFVA